MSKTDSMFAMLRRVVKNGFVPRYVLTDSWFFSEALVQRQGDKEWHDRLGFDGEDQQPGVYRS